MRFDIREILENQAAWQRSRAERPWAQELRESAAMRHAMTSLKKHFSPIDKARPKSKSNLQSRIDSER